MASKGYSRPVEQRSSVVGLLFDASMPDPAIGNLERLRFAPGLALGARKRIGEIDDELARAGPGKIACIGPRLRLSPVGAISSLPACEKRPRGLCQPAPCLRLARRLAERTLEEDRPDYDPEPSATFQLESRSD